MSVAFGGMTGRHALVAVAEIGRDREPADAAHLHADDAALEAHDDLLGADPELQRLAARARAVEDGAVGERARVVDAARGRRCGPRRPCPRRRRRPCQVVVNDGRPRTRRRSVAAVSAPRRPWARCTSSERSSASRPTAIRTADRVAAVPLRELRQLDSLGPGRGALRRLAGRQQQAHDRELGASGRRAPVCSMRPGKGQGRRAARESR